MKAEQEFAAEIAHDYARKGWEVENSEEALTSLGFRPDIFLRRGDEYLVVEIKMPGMDHERSISELRAIVERRPNWRLEVQLLPPKKEHAKYEVAQAETPTRLKLVDRLFLKRQYSNAVLIAWVVMETSLRKLYSENRTEQAPTPIHELFLSSYEAERITDDELRQLQRALELRNRVVHGYTVELNEKDAKSVLSLAHTLAERSEKTTHPPSAKT